MPLASVAPETRAEAVMPDTPTKPDALQAVNAAASNFHQSKKSAAARSVRVSMVRSQSTVTRQQLAVDSGDVDSMRQFVAEEAINAITNLNEAPTNFHQVCACTRARGVRRRDIIRPTRSTGGAEHGLLRPAIHSVVAPRRSGACTVECGLLAHLPHFVMRRCCRRRVGGRCRQRRQH